MKNLTAENEDIELLTKELALAQAINTSFLDNIPESIAIFKAIDGGNNFIITHYNPMAESLDKISRADVVGKKVTVAFPSIKEFGLFSVIHEVWKTGKAQSHQSKFYEDEIGRAHV